MKTPCEKLEKEARKKASIRHKDYWGAGILYRQAAECYRSYGLIEKAKKTAKKSLEMLNKAASSIGFGPIAHDIETTLRLLYSLSSGAEKERYKMQLFYMLQARAREFESHGNILEAVKIYRNSIEFAPSGSTIIEILEHAISLLEQLADKYSKAHHPHLPKILSMIEEFQTLLSSISLTGKEVYMIKLSMRLPRLLEEEIAKQQEILLNLINTFRPSSVKSEKGDNETKILFELGNLKGSINSAGILLEIDITASNWDNAIDFIMNFVKELPKRYETHPGLELLDVEIFPEIDSHRFITLIEKIRNSASYGLTIGELVFYIDFLKKVRVEKKLEKTRRKLSEVLESYLEREKTILLEEMKNKVPEEAEVTDITLNEIIENLTEIIRKIK